jgi:hypothetical protein
MSRRRLIWPHAMNNLHFMEGIKPHDYLTVGGDVARKTARDFSGRIPD